MERMTRKALLNTAKMVGAIKVANNVYLFENATYDITRGTRNDSTQEVLELVKKVFKNASSCFTRDIVYSAGVYGCSGKLAQVIAVDEARNWLGVAGYVYF